MGGHATERRRTRVPPSLLIGIAPVVVFAVIEIIRSRPSDDYEQVGLTLHSVVWALLVPETITGAALALIVTGLGWWRIVIHDVRRGGPRWALLAPVLLVVVELARLGTIRWGSQPVAYFLLLALATLLVGFFEETMARGMLLVGLRRRVPEIWVWLLSSAVFGALHLLNALAGQPLGTTLAQVVFAASFGSLLYVARRMTRTLVVPMLLHGFWDFGVIASNGAGIGHSAGGYALLGLVGLLTFGVLVFGIVTGAFVALHTDRPLRLVQRWRPVPPRSALEVPPVVAADDPAAAVPVAGGAAVG